MNDYLERAMESVKLEMTLKIIEAAGEGPIPEPIVTFLRILVNHGCPVDAVLSAIPELAKEINLEEEPDSDE